MNLEKASIQLSYMLRHSRDPLYVDLDGGWASVDRVLEVLRDRYPQMERPHIEQIVARDKKGRYAFDATGTRIRANQGHSIPGVKVEMEAPEPPVALYHGTAERFLSSIMEQGLKPMTRQFVHLSATYETAVTVGARHGKPVVLRVDAERFAAEGNELLLSANGVWQAKAVPAKYLSMEEE